MHCSLFYVIFIILLSFFCTVAAEDEDCAPKNFSIHPIEINAACSETSFNVKFNSIENFYTSLDFGIDEKCKGDVNFQLQLDNCTVADVSKADIPGGVVLVVNKDVNNVISGNKVELELRNNTLKIKGGGKGFQQNSSCVLAETDTQEEPKANIRMINSKNGCNVKVLLDPDATYHIASSEEVNSLFVFASNKLLIISLIVTATVLIGLLIFVMLWYHDKLPGSSSDASPAHCTYFTRDVFSQPDPKPYLQPELRGHSIRQPSLESEAEIFEPAQKPRRSIISLYSNHAERRIE